MAAIDNIIGNIQAMPARKKITLLIVAVLTITAGILLFNWTQKADMQVLYSNLSEEDSGAIIQKLNEMKIPYKATQGGIMVPSDKVYDIRIQLASQGLPQGGGIGFEVFDKTSFNMTDFVQKLNYRRALQGELSRTIRSLNEVDQARVQLAVPEKTLFSKNDDRPKASVLVKLKQGRRLTQGQVQGIVHLVSSSVEGLDTKDVTVVDSRGEMLTSGAVANDAVGMTSSQREYQQNVEKDLENRVVSILEPIVGKDKVKAKIAANIDFTQIEKTEERYDPDSQVIRSEQRNTEKSSSGTAGGGVPGTAANLPGNAAVTQVASNKGQSEKKNETINYEISKITSHTINSSGDIKKLSIVALVDGVYTSQQGSKDKKYSPRPEEDVKKFEDMVKNAVGYSADRGDEVRVVNMPFEAVPQEEFAESKTEIMPMVMTAAKYIVPLIAVVFLFLFVVKPLMKTLTIPSPAQMQLSLPKTVAEIERAMEGGKELPERALAIEWAKKNPKAASSVIKGWIEES